MNEILIELLVIAGVIGISVALHALLQRRFEPAALRKQNDVAGYLFSAVGVIYAVVLGFVVVVVWEKYDNTVSTVDAEIAAVSDLYRATSGLPQPVRGRLRTELQQYAHDMIYVEWPLMNQRVIVPKDLVLLETIAHQVHTFSPANAGQSNAQQQADTLVDKLFDARRLRLIQDAPSVPLVLWFALITGAGAMMFFAFLFGVENRPAQLLMTAILAGVIAMLFVVIAEFDSPFSGSVKISSEGWSILLDHLPNIP